MSTSQRIPITFDAALKGGWPMLEFCEPDEMWPADWLGGLCDCIQAGELEDAVKRCAPHLSATFLCSEVGELDSEDAIDAVEVEVRQPFVEQSVDGEPVVLFRWWQARFQVSVPRDLVLAWSEEDESGARRYSEERYQGWVEEHDFWGFQDGVRYSLWGVLYELDGMGDNVCVPNPDSVNEALKGLDGG
jgi:hypothetical protein